MRHRARSLLASSAVLIAAAGCSGKREEISDVASVVVPDQAAIEVFSALIPPSTVEFTAIGCLSIHDKDASKAVIDALAERHRRVLPASRCHPAVRTQDGPREIAYSLSGFKRYGDTAAEIEGTSYAGHLAASCTLIDLELISGKWRVSKQSLLRISQLRATQSNSNRA